MNAHDSTPEFSRIIELRDVDGQPHTYKPTAEEALALARRFGLVRIKSFSAEVTLSAAGPVVTATGRLQAAIVQSCAVSGEDLPATINEKLALRFLPAQSPKATAPDEEQEISADECDEIEYTGARFDLGEALAQSLALGIDPYATGPNAAQVRASGLLGEEASGPFAALAALKKTD